MIKRQDDKRTGSQKDRIKKIERQGELTKKGQEDKETRRQSYRNKKYWVGRQRNRMTRKREDKET